MTSRRPPHPSTIQVDSAATKVLPVPPGWTPDQARLLLAVMEDLLDHCIPDVEPARLARPRKFWVCMLLETLACRWFLHDIRTHLEEHLADAEGLKLRRVLLKMATQNQPAHPDLLDFAREYARDPGKFDIGDES